LGYTTKTWLWSPVRDDEVHKHGAPQRTHSCSVLLFFTGNIASGIGVFDVPHIISTFATFRVRHSKGGVSSVEAVFLISWRIWSSVPADEGWVCWLAEGELLSACVSIIGRRE
jgi:hypothetical protein